MSVLKPSHRTTPSVSGAHSALADVWRELDRASFAVVSYVTPNGSPRSSGVVFATRSRRLYVVTAADSWKARQLSDGDEVAVTVPVRRGGVLSLVAPIPPATITFRATVTVHGTVSRGSSSVPTKLARLLPDARKAGCLLELSPQGRFLTYGIGMSLREMTHPDRALARVPVD
jgi:hypothetical protein